MIKKFLRTRTAANTLDDAQWMIFFYTFKII